jgi:hypothetical protein
VTAKTRHNSDSQLIELLAAGTTQTEAAKLAGCSPRTVGRRLADPEFAESVRQFRAATLESAAGRIGVMIDRALSTLEEIHADGQMAPAARIQAARCILEQSLKFRDSVELEQRLKTLEERSYSVGRECA